MLTDEEIKILKNNYKFGREHCCKILNKTISAIQHKAVRLKLKVDKNILSNILSNKVKKHWDNFDKPFNTYNVNPDIFINVSTIESSYILGLLWSDGFIINYGKGYKNVIGIECLSTDAETFIKIFNRTGKWTISKRKRKHRVNEITSIVTNNRDLVEYLVSMDYNKKSYVSADKILKTIPTHLKSYFFLGVVDGDGCFYKNKVSHFMVSSTIEQDWSYFKNLCDSLDIKYSIKKREHINKNGNYSHSSSLRITNIKGIKKIGEYIYQNVNIDHIGLKRKFEKFKLIEYKNIK